MKPVTLALMGLVAAIPPALPQTKPINTPPAGFTALFNGTDLTGWHGRKGDYSPHAQALLPIEDLYAMMLKWDADRDLHWHVDKEKGEIVSDGQSVFLATAKNYGDFELYVDWLMVNHNGDSGVYLRGYPQVQIWDVDNPREVANGAPRGSGALWNDNPDNPGKWPLVKADNPVGTWNTFHIKMIGTRVWVWFNDKLTVDGQVLDNYFDRKIPILPTGAIELQTHGSEIRFRNIYLREIGAAEAASALAMNAPATAPAGGGFGGGGGIGSGARSLGNGTTPPTVITRVDPEYSVEARNAKLSGSVQLSIVVDTNGKAVDIKVIKSLGMGLDEKAVEAVKKWQFKPATNKGELVSFPAMVEVNFRL